MSKIGTKIISVATIQGEMHTKMDLIGDALDSKVVSDIVLGE